MTWLLRVRKWWPAMLAGLAWVAHLFTVRKARRDGKKEAYDEMQEQDRAEADAIRKRVDDADRVHDTSGVRFRD